MSGESGVGLEQHRRFFKVASDVVAVSGLLLQGADVNARDEHGNTPLHAAIVVGATDTVKLLVRNGASIEAQNDDGDTPLHFAMRRDDSEVARMLLQRGASMYAKNHAGQTPSNAVLLLGKGGAGLPGKTGM